MARAFACLTLVILLFVPPAHADVTVSADVDRDQISIHGQVTLTVTIAGKDDNLGAPKLPPLNDFIATGTGSRQNLVIENGQISRTRSYTYNLIPRKVGTLTIGPVTVPTSKGDLKTNPIEITVTQATLTPQTRRNVPTENSGRTQRRGTTEPFFVEAETDKDTVYLGEQVTYTFSYYRNATLRESNSFSPPQTTGFISIDLPPQRKRSTIVDGETYDVVQVVTAMFPTRTGEMTIGPAQLRVVPDVFSGLLGRDPFGMFSRPGSQLTSGEPRNLATRPISIFVKPLPPVPRGKIFSGAVGVCKLASSISTDSVGVGDPVTITWTVSGEGRKDLVDAPRIDWPADLETYPPTTDLQRSTTNDVVSETKTFSIAVVPRKQGAITIPAPQLTYFDPDAAAYKTAQGRSLTLRVGPPRAGLTTASPTQTISASSSTIRYLKPAPEEWRQFGVGHRETWFVLIQLTPPLVVGVLFLWRRRREAPEQRARGARQKAVRKARARLAQARRITDTLPLAQEITAAFREYLAARFSLTSGDLLESDWPQRLRAVGASEEDARKAVEILQWTDRARFGGGHAGESISADTVLALMERLDKCAV